jgi:hypothetical protein
MRVALVSGSDSNYYPLLLEWIHSIRRFEQSANMDICVIDSGLTDFQRTELSQYAQKIVTPDWPDGVPLRKVQDKPFLKSCLCRPFINRLFPGYDMYVWMDSDTWVQEWEAVESFIHAAQKGDRMAVTIGADRALERPVRLKWLLGFPIAKSFYYTHGLRVFGRKIAAQLLDKYTIFAGCFALSADAPHWNIWQKLVVEAAQKGEPFPAEQLSMGKMIYIDGLRAEFLPSYMHWVCATLPKYNEVTQKFVEPSYPFTPIGIMHLSGVDAVRTDRAKKAKLLTPDDHMIEKNLRYPDFDAGTLQIEKVKRK